MFLHIYYIVYFYLTCCDICYFLFGANDLYGSQGCKTVSE